MPTPTKIATRIKSAITGEEFFIGTRGLEEKVEVRLNAPSGVTWTSYQLTVQDQSAGSSSAITLDSGGTCIFYIKMGDVYNITFPIVGTYIQPVPQTYTASLVSRQIEYTYSYAPVSYEQLNVRFVTTAAEQTVHVLDGLSVSCQVDGVERWAGTINNGSATVTIPYGYTYTIVLPELPGWKHDNAGITHVSGVVSRDLMVHYYYIDEGIFGYDTAGTRYTISEIEAGISGGTLSASDIVAGYFTDEDLENASRGDGTYGCSFMWQITGGTTSGYWSNPYTQFDQSKLPNENNETLAKADCHGNINTTYILQECAAQTATTYTSTMCTNARAKTLTIGGVDRQGFVPAYGQIKRLWENLELMKYLYAALGIPNSRPKIESGSWWTSCQYSQQNGVTLSGGAFINGIKGNSYSVLVAFDL